MSVVSLVRPCRRAAYLSLPLRRLLHATPAAPGISRLPAGTHTIPETRAQVEVSTEEWKYVERLFPPKAIPKPTAAPGEVMPSGWVAPSAKPGDHPYFVRRNPSHQLPVYLTHNPIISKYRTKISHVEGDIWALLEELRAYLQERREPMVLNMRAHEPHQRIEIKGQFVTEGKVLAALHNMQKRSRPSLSSYLYIHHHYYSKIYTHRRSSPFPKPFP